MSFWGQDPYKPLRDGFVDGQGAPWNEEDGEEFWITGLSEGAEHAANLFEAIAHNEGLSISFALDPVPCENTGSRLCAYDPLRLEITHQGAEQTFPQYRWAYALAMGYHFTRHHFFQRSSREVWRMAAEAWATSFLGAHAAQMEAAKLPDNRSRFRAKTPSPPVPNEKALEVWDVQRALEALGDQKKALEALDLEALDLETLERTLYQAAGWKRQALRAKRRAITAIENLSRWIEVVQPSPRSRRGCLSIAAMGELVAELAKGLEGQDRT